MATRIVCAPSLVQRWLAIFGSQGSTAASFVLQLEKERHENLLFLIGTDRYYHNDRGYNQPRRCAQEWFGEIHESPDEEQNHMHKGDESIEQLHHDGASVRAVQAFDVEILLLDLLMLHTSHFGLQTLQVFFNI